MCAGYFIYLKLKHLIHLRGVAASTSPADIAAAKLIPAEPNNTVFLLGSGDDPVGHLADRGDRGVLVDYLGGWEGHGGRLQRVGGLQVHYI